MKKVIIGLVAIGAVAIVGMPYVTGVVAEKETSQLVNNMNQHFAAYGTTEIVDYQRGFNTTQASYKLRLNEASPVDVNYSCNGEHGITSYEYSCKLEDMPKYQDWVAKNLNGNDPVTITGSVSALGHVTQHINLESFTLKSNDSDIKIGEGQLSFSSDQSLHDLDFEGSFDGISAFSNGTNFSFDKLNVDGDMVQHESTLPSGTITMEVDQLAITNPEQGTFALSDVQVSSWSKIETEHLASGTEVSIAKASSSKQAISIEDLSWQLNFDGIPAAQIGELSQQFSAINSNKNSLNANSPSNQAMSFANVSNKFEKLLVPGLSVDTAAQAVINDQTNIAKLDVELLEPLKPQDAMLIMFDPASLLKKLSVGINLQLSNSLIETTAFAQGISQNQLFTHKGELHTLDIKTNSTSAEINGKSMSLADFVQTVMSGSN